MNEIFNVRLLAVLILAFLVLIFWDTIFLKKQRLQKEQQVQQQKTLKEQGQNSSNSSDAGTTKIQRISTSTDEKYKKIARVKLTNQKIDGSISLQAGRIDDIKLKKYKKSLQSDEPFQLFIPKNKLHAYFFESGWISNNKMDLPTSETIWQVVEQQDNHIVLRWQNKQDVIFQKTINIDDQYMITVTDKVINKSNTAVTLAPFSLIVRTGTPNVADLFISHEGIVSGIDSDVERIDYDDLLTQDYHYRSNGGYAGFSDKYWLSAIIFDSQKQTNLHFVGYVNDYNVSNYQIDNSIDSITISANNSYESTEKIFVGPKEFNIIDYYDNKFNISNFDYVIDFGWFFFLTKPMISFLLWIYSLVGNFGIAIIIFTISIRAIILPVAYKSYISMAKMRNLQPQMKELKQRYANDLNEYNKQIMALYKKEKVNPISGCLPILLQIPIFFSIYKVIFISVEMRHAPFFGWINDLSSKDPTNIFTLFGLIPIDLPSFLHVGIWPILMGLTMFIQQKLSSNSYALDSMQQKVMHFLPIVLVFVLSSFPSGLVIYWTLSNIISIIQQLIINRSINTKINVKSVN